MHRKKYVHFNTLEPIKPLLRAYTLGYLTVTTPRLFAFLRTVRRSHLQSREILSTLQKILITSTQINRFPTAAAVIVGGATALPHLIQACIDYVLSSQRRGTTRLSNRLAALIRFLCTFWSAWLAFSLLNRDESWARKRAISQSNTTISTGAPRTSALHQPPPPPYHPRYAGKTIDFTAFAFCRALDVAVIALWTRTRSRSWHPEQRNPRLANFTRKIVDPSVFAGSAAIIMWSWFYSPERLPRSYNHWISKAADIDPRLIQALRLARQGNFVYGEDTGQATLLTGLCQELNLPDEFADPSKTIPIPLELAPEDLIGDPPVNPADHCLTNADLSDLSDLSVHMKERYARHLLACWYQDMAGIVLFTALFVYFRLPDRSAWSISSVQRMTRDRVDDITEGKLTVAYFIKAFPIQVREIRDSVGQE
ncbi:hypothetical protein AYO21_08862 [Fonsecaea monophora]|uniref:Integral membrane protein n=1 Tax=Fonsecaea monophora TaxID=254056 RepID=A0A177EZY8_9EURO|nr:hypothetical protein AYO21_08862 [Fonsecaea monophora]OAG36901.1 hypothetical protein AYO21_08862 [Fonsecaea monophora]